MLIAGIDEAGRGSVLGPLVIAGVLIQDYALPNLVQLGVKDSKRLSSKKREVLYKEIQKVVEQVTVIKVSPKEIDAVVNTGEKFRRLNWLEAQKMGTLLNFLKTDVAYVDAADISEERFKNQILEQLTKKITVVSEH